MQTDGMAPVLRATAIQLHETWQRVERQLDRMPPGFAEPRPPLH